MARTIYDDWNEWLEQRAAGERAAADRARSTPTGAQDKLGYDLWEESKSFLPGEANLTGKVQHYDTPAQYDYLDRIADVPRSQNPPTPPDGGDTGGGDGVDWSLYPNGRAGEVLQFGDMPAASTFSYGNAPEYVSRYQKLIDDYLGRVLNPQPFSYDAASDPLYQQYAQQYGDAGRRAMQDTLAQISARTGGLASSYAGSASQQAYNQYMARLADKVPELQQLAYSMYNDELDRDSQRLSILRALEGDDYGRYGDRLSQWNTDRTFNYGVAQDEYSRNLALAQLAAGYGDLSGIQGLGIDTSKYGKVYGGSGGGGGSKSAADDAAEKYLGIDTEEALKLLKTEDPTIISSPAFQNWLQNYLGVSPDAVADGNKQGALDDASTITNYEDAVDMLKGIGVTEKPVTKRAWEAHKNNNSNAVEADRWITNYPTYEDYLAEFLKTAVEVAYGE